MRFCVFNPSGISTDDKIRHLIFWWLFKDKMKSETSAWSYRGGMTGWFGKVTC
jgi:hypothetical protein